MALNDILFSEDFLFEGEQADAYRARKAAEEANRKAQQHKDEIRDVNRLAKKNKAYINNPNTRDATNKAAEMMEREDKRRSDAADKANKGIRKLVNPSKAKETKKAYERFQDNDLQAQFAAERHAKKRQPIAASAILYNGSIELV